MRILLFKLAALALAGCAAIPTTTMATSIETRVTGKRWLAEIPGDVPEAQRPRLEFAAGGRLLGFTGCNSLSGQWRAEGEQLRLDALAMTKRGCLGPAGELEERFLAAVNAKSRVAIEGERLVAQGEGGARLAFVAP
jgi:putative lipoprotein